jgi:hypothetical protein
VSGSALLPNIQPVLTAGEKEDDMKFIKDLNRRDDANRRSNYDR